MISVTILILNIVAQMKTNLTSCDKSCVIDSLEDLFERKDIRPLWLSHDYDEEALMKSKESLYTKIWKRGIEMGIKKSLIRKEEEAKAILPQLVEGSAVFITDSLYINVMSSLACEQMKETKNKYEKLWISKQKFSQRKVAFVYN